MDPAGRARCFLQGLELFLVYGGSTHTLEKRRRSRVKRRQRKCEPEPNFGTRMTDWSMSQATPSEPPRAAPDGSTVTRGGGESQQEPGVLYVRVRWVEAPDSCRLEGRRKRNRFPWRETLTDAFGLFSRRMCSTCS
ncbi:hypothetical protein GN956_G9613 [Arapaima gigas]